MKSDLLIAVVAVAMLLTACGNPQKDIDAEKAAAEIVAAISFEDKLELIDDDIAEAVYGFDDENVEESATYIGSGATAEEVTVVEFEKLTDADKALFEKRIQAQIKSYETYIPAEIERLKNAVVIYSGNVAVLCVSADSNEAKKVIENLIF